MGDFHVVVVGRTGGHVGSTVSVVGPGLKRHAITTCEAEFRRQYRLPTSVALVAQVVFTGSEDEATDFYGRLSDLMENSGRPACLHGFPGEGWDCCRKGWGDKGLDSSSGREAGS